MFRAGARTLRNLEGVHPLIVEAVMLAFTYTEVDFCIIDGGGLRTQAQANDNAARGVGIKNSLHLPQADGYGHAVDLVAYEGGPRWPNNPSEVRRLYDPIHEAFFRACDELGLLIQNGADWDNDGNKGERGEFDWPHFQIPRWAKTVAEAEKARDRRARNRACPCMVVE